MSQILKKTKNNGKNLLNFIKTFQQQIKQKHNQHKALFVKKVSKQYWLRIKVKNKKTKRSDALQQHVSLT